MNRLLLHISIKEKQIIMKALQLKRTIKELKGKHIFAQGWSSNFSSVLLEGEITNVEFVGFVFNKKSFKVFVGKSFSVFSATDVRKLLKNGFHKSDESLKTGLNITLK